MSDDTKRIRKQLEYLINSDFEEGDCWSRYLRSIRDLERISKDSESASERVLATNLQRTYLKQLLLRAIRLIRVEMSLLQGFQFWLLFNFFREDLERICADEPDLSVAIAYVEKVQKENSKDFVDSLDYLLGTRKERRNR